ncbi:MAG: hypothetical protein MMC33_001293 [Icmadophila ericetorum]|nr:hypothetical protein [Icmadophila ericetorum]
MALSFVTGSSALAQWGFSVGDIAVLAGAGRKVGNWLMSAKRDQELFEFLKVPITDIIQRKGFIDTLALHKRWDNKLVLLKNGKRHEVRIASKGALVENMDSFTWLMTLFVAALDSAMPTKMLRTIVSQFLMEMVRDKTDGVEYLLHEVQYHVEGWLSNACVRNISLVARKTWQSLARDGAHPPGDIPEIDSSEVLRLLYWIVSGKDNKFLTSSTDVTSLATILAELGIDLLAVGDETLYDENRLVVCLSTSPIIRNLEEQFGKEKKRRGMRIPLDEMEECVSLWPGDNILRNSLRHIFRNGMDAAKGLKLKVAETHHSLDEEDMDIHYHFGKTPRESVGRPHSWRILEKFLLAPTPRAAKIVDNITRTWPTKSLTNINFWLEEVDMRADSDDEISHFDLSDRECLAQLQVFLIGYYYAVLSPLLDTSQLSIQEAYGSWGWNDIQVVKVVLGLRLGLDKERGEYPRHEVMKILGYFFAGADYSEQLKPLRARSVGIFGKLGLVTASLMGGADTPTKLGMFYLLDVDPTCIPSNSRGLILGGIRKPCTKTPPKASASELSLATATTSGPDFTSHVEPDWGYDTQRVLIAYRYHGRIIHRISPVDGDLAVLLSWIAMAEEEEPLKLIPAIPVQLEELYGGHVVYSADNYGPNDEVPESWPDIVILTHGLPKARMCVVGMYGAGVASLCSNALRGENACPALIA